MQIEPSEAIRKNYSAISKQAHESGEPIYITKRGKGDLVVMSIDAFERREEELRLRARLELAEASRIAGEPAYTIGQARARLAELYGQEKV